jgi:type IV pilus assembly protein PilY1
MRTLARYLPRSLTAASAAVALIAAAGGAHAQQTDTNPPLPNVLLLIDNSGSMERMIDGNTPETDPSTAVPPTTSGNNSCNCVDNGSGTITCASWSSSPAGVAPAPNRWNIVQTAMTGSLQSGFNCVAMPRTPGSTFDKEYHLGVSPYDINYYLPFHRLVARDTSGGTPGVACVVAPGGLPGVPTGTSEGLGAAQGVGGLASDYPAGSIIARQYGKLPPSAVLCSSQTQGAVTGFPQYPDGAITTMRDLMRFGMMTFDSDPDPGTGVTGANAVNTAAPFTGMWSYFPNWNAGGTGFQGDPASCGTLSPFTVGARNPSAPPWEGRMVGFPAAATPDLAHQEANNDEISSVILATRPYGATPTAGMFAGAQYYFWNDPTGPGKTDPYVQGNCRNEYIIFLTDGAPNLDLQPSCSATSTSVPPIPGTCPFPIPYSSTGTAATLYANGVSTASQSSVKTYVIGFALSDPNGLPDHLRAVRAERLVQLQRRQPPERAALRPVLRASSAPRATAATGVGVLRADTRGICRPPSAPSSRQDREGTRRRERCRPTRRSSPTYSPPPPPHRRATSPSSSRRSTRRPGSRGREICSGSATSARTPGRATPSRLR